MVDTEFNLKNYRKIIKDANTRCIILPIPPKKSDDYDYHIIWRHDIDISMDHAVKMAEIDHDEGISSMFMVLASSPFYNLFEENNIDALYTIANYNHIIGLHFDPTTYNNIRTSIDIISFIEAEKRAIESHVGAKLKTFSLHNPSLLNDCTREKFSTPQVCGMINMNSTYIKTTYDYCSDSNMRWCGKSLEEKINSKLTYLHAVTHPIWWLKPHLSNIKKIYHQTHKTRNQQREYYDKIMREVKSKGD
jgi:hypothetical protein